MDNTMSVRPVQSDSLGTVLVPLLALVIFINYVDRGSLAITAPLIRDQLHFSSTQIGILLSSFFWTYVPAQILAGWLSERISPCRILALGLALWSFATIGLGFANEFAGFLMFRILLGIGESAAFPCSAKLLASHVAPQQLGKANGLISVGMRIGPAFGTMAGGLLLAHSGWRAVYVLFGTASLLWLLPWRHASRLVAAQALAKPKLISPALSLVARCRDLWGAVLGHFCMNYAFYFILSWLPLYLVKERGLSIEAMAQIGGTVFLVFAASGFFTGMITDRLIQGGRSINQVRKTFAVSAHALIAVCLVLTGVGSLTVALISLLVAGVALGLGMPNVYAIGQTLAGPRAAGKWMGIQNSLANCAGIIAPVVTGTIADRTGNYSMAFFIAAAVALIGILGWGLVVRKVETTDWNAS